MENNESQSVSCDVRIFYRSKKGNFTKLKRFNYFNLNSQYNRIMSPLQTH